MKIRLEEEKDYFMNENLTREAFWNVYRPGCYEHYILHKIRTDKCYVKELSYVMEDKQRLVGSIVYAKRKVRNENGENEVLLFGPVSILPEYQGAGYGKKLIKFTLKKAKELGYPAVVITGKPEYYEKFGFKPASKYNIFYEGMENKENPFFMVKVLDNHKMKGIYGIYTDPDVYTVNQEEVEQFDKKFPKKKKEKREGQLE